MTTPLTGQPLQARPTRFGRFTVLAAFLWSLLALPFGLWQLLDPDNGPYSAEVHDPTIHLPAAVPDWVAPVALIAAGLAGLLVSRADRRLWPFTALFAVVFGMLLSTTTPISLAGYLCAFLLPIAAVVVPILLARGTTARLITAVAMAAVLVGLGAGGVVDYAAVGDFVVYLGGSTAAVGSFMLVQVWTVLGGGIWTALTLQHLVRHGESVPVWLTPDKVATWGRVASWTAFACALPYGLTRMTWLTPWPWPETPAGLDFDFATRVWGLLLGFAALGGGALCLGLTQRWGERWPFWMFALKGRPIPPMVAIVPAAVVAALFTFVAVPMAVLGIRQDAAVLMVLGFPFWLWGPALGAATLAYAVRRGVIKPGAVR